MTNEDLEKIDLKKFRRVELNNYFQTFDKLLNERGIIDPLKGTKLDENGEIVEDPDWVPENTQEFMRDVHETWYGQVDITKYQKA